MVWVRKSLFTSQKMLTSTNGGCSVVTGTSDKGTLGESELFVFICLSLRQVLTFTNIQVSIALLKHDAWSAWCKHAEFLVLFNNRVLAYTIFSDVDHDPGCRVDQSVLLSRFLIVFLH